MSTSRITRSIAVFAAASLLGGCAGIRRAQNPVSKVGLTSNTPLYEEVRGLDDRLSEEFNAHDLDGLMGLFSSDVEFYHDTGGLQGFDDVRAGFKSLFAKDNGIKRELLAGTLRVFPIKDYGALELGTHRFCHDEQGHTECGIFEFVHIWRHEGEGWKLSRAVSYGH